MSKATYPTEEAAWKAQTHDPTLDLGIVDQRADGLWEIRSRDLQTEADRLRALSDADFAAEVRLSTRYVLILRREGYPERRITIPSLSDALEAAHVDAAWLRGIGSVLISPVLYAARAPQKG